MGTARRFCAVRIAKVVKGMGKAKAGGGGHYGIDFPDD